MIRVTNDIALGEDEIVEQFIRSSGPGGQNVNKVATAVQLRFDVARSPNLPGPVRERLKRLAGRRLTGDGVLIIDARRYRTREQNRRDALDRLVALVRKAAIAPTPRKATRPTAASRRRRLEGKQRRGILKRGRHRVRDADE
ncbi:MAG: aminoacyl-tRNA hydrolase [Gammaproteobacteria bacterium]|jgi:ribosome-associated protein|nr:aminoacyl-tRNA hydrolase [Gammaproteobacteria bacterium]